MPRISTQRLMGKVSRAIWTENELKQLKCGCIFNWHRIAFSPEWLCQSWPHGKCQELHFNQTRTAAWVWHIGDSESIYQTDYLEVRFVKYGQYTPRCSWEDSLSKSKEKGKRILTPRNKCAHPGTHRSFILWHSELSMHSSSVFPTCNSVSRKCLILDISGPFCL